MSIFTTFYLLCVDADMDVCATGMPVEVRGQLVGANT